MLFLFYVNIFRMQLQSRLSSQPLMIPAPWVLFHIGWSICLIPSWVTDSYFLVETKEAKLKPNTFSYSHFSMFSCLSSSPDTPAYLLVFLNNNILHLVFSHLSALGWRSDLHKPLPALKPLCSSIKTPVTLQTLSTKIPAYIFPITSYNSYIQSSLLYSCSVKQSQQISNLQTEQHTQRPYYKASR